MIGKEARAKEGKWGGGSSEPVGYDYDPATEELTINEYEAMQIREAVELFLKGTPLRTICREFEAKGYTYRGRSGSVSLWDPKRLKYVFANKLYIGFMKHGDNWYPGSHVPILQLETFERLQKLLEQRAEMYDHHKKKCSSYTTILGGMLYCKHCGAKYTKQAGRKSKSGPAPLYYACYSRNKKVPKMIKDPNCKNKNWKMEALDQVVLEEIHKLESDPDYFHAIRRRKSENSDAPNKIEILQREIETIDGQISRFMDLYGLGAFTIDQVSSKVEPLAARKKALAAELEELNAESVKAMDEQEVMEIVHSFSEILQGGDLNEIRLALETLIYYIDLDEDDVYIHWKFA